MRQLRTATPNLPYAMKSDIIDLAKWIARQKKFLRYQTYNFNELVESKDAATATIKIYFEYAGEVELSFENISKIRQILTVIKSNQYPIADIYKKLLTQFRTK
jgi:hypothetical protein